VREREYRIKQAREVADGLWLEISTTSHVRKRNGPANGRRGQVI
jgi:hypothetical protein